MKMPWTGVTLKLKTAEAQSERERFEARCKQHEVELNRIALSVLVWGPSLRLDTAVARKRRQIYQELLEQGHNAVLSEHLYNPNKRLSLRGQELSQAEAAHIIIILVEDALGAMGEAHDFGLRIGLVSKMYVLAPSTYRSGYAASGVLRLLEHGYGGVYWYEEQDLEQCLVMTKALMRVQARREIYAYAALEESFLS